MKARFFLVVLCLCFGDISIASELIYTPINPSFGGNPFNGSVLLNSALAQNEHKEEVKKLSELEEFDQMMRRSVFYRLNADISRDMFDENGKMKMGEYSIGDYDISVVDGADFYSVTLTNRIEGKSSEIKFPKFNVEVVQ